jgi:fructose-1,6-bisphosphatase/inositol monophosphatase family enzyme
MTFVSPAQRAELESAIIHAGHEILGFWPGGQARPMQVKRKVDGSLVTDADLASNRIIIKALERIFPEDAIFSEELPPSPSPIIKKRIWFIDPLDGTKSFVEGGEGFSILVALCKSGAPVSGFVHFPARNRLAWSVKGMGAWYSGKQMHVSSSTEFRKHSVCWRHSKAKSSEIFYERWVNSARAFIKLCRGDFDGLVIKVRGHQEWDFAAPAALVYESGGTVSDENGEPIVFGAGPIKLNYLVASNGILHDQLLNILATG